jgi:putative IMPACT (imprinted ancient) family translation regulator
MANETMGMEVEIVIDYNELELVKYYCKNNNINIVNTVYENNIKCYLEVTQEELERLLDKNQNNCNILEYKVIEKRNIRKVL